MNKQTILVAVTVAVVGGAFALGTYVYQQRRDAQLGFIAEKSFSTFVRDYSPVMGSPGAKVYLIEFSDPACETCAAFAPFVKKLLASYPDKLKFVMRYAPFHEGSDILVKIAEAAKKQGKFWEALDTMYRSQPAWASHHDPHPELIWGFLSEAGLDVDRLKQDMNDPEVARNVLQDIADAQALSVQKTPGFFVNGKPLVSFGYRQLEQLVAQEIAATYPN